MKDKLALGCGDRYRGDDFIHLDLSDLDHVDVVHDLEKGELPFEDDRFNHVEAVHVLEHLKQGSLIDLLKEVHRVTETGGTVRIVMPHFLSWNASDVDHYRAGSRKSFVQFCKGYGMNSPYPDLFREESVDYEINGCIVYRFFRFLLSDRKVARFLPNAVDEIIYRFSTVIEE